MSPGNLILEPRTRSWALLVSARPSSAGGLPPGIDFSPGGPPMVLARRCASTIALTLSIVLLVPGETRAQATIEVYPGPGVDTHKSNLYQVEVFDGSAW